ncbi:argininosuccinate lyase [Pyramidobacter porci]
MRERLKAAPSSNQEKYLGANFLKVSNERSFYNMSRLNQAHTLMLYRQGIISRRDAQMILRSLIALEKKGNTALTLDPKYEDYYYNVEMYIINDIGINIGGKLHTARSRNDLHSTILRMDIRDQLLNFFPQLNALRNTLIIKSEEYRNVVMTGYTHMQPAQPITLGFYFAGVAEALERDFDRIYAAYQHLNYATLGAGAFAGTSFPIDRRFTAELLGFKGPIVNTLDAIASRDYVLEIIATLAILASTINRVAHDLYYWCTDEFRYIELDDSICVTSSIMPQKKNPAVLEYIKAKCSHLLAAFADAFCCMRGIPFAHSRDLGGETTHHLWDAFMEIEAMTVLTEEVLNKIKVNEKNMKARVNENFCTATELADELVREEHISFRVAHEIVGQVVMKCVDAGLNCQGITSKKLDEAALNFAGRSFKWTKGHIDKVMDTTSSVENRISEGSPRSEETEKLTKQMSLKLDNDIDAYNRLQTEVKERYRILLDKVQDVLNSND